LLNLFFASPSHHLVSLITCKAQQLLPTQPPPPVAVAPAPLLRNQVIILIFITNVAAVNCYFYLSSSLPMLSLLLTHAVAAVLCAAGIAAKRPCCLHFIVASAIGVFHCRFFS